MRRTIEAEDYLHIQTFLESQCGILLGQGKEYLASSRLGPILDQFHMDDYKTLTEALRHPKNRRLQTAVIDAMTTNETFWFRDTAHFKILTDSIAPEFPRGMRIWSAASSSGQECYSISMTIKKAQKQRQLNPGFRFEILGTDLSPRVLEHAKKARYCGLSAIRGLTEEQTNTFFSRDGDCIRVLPEYRAGVHFRQINLTKPFDTVGRFDLVFCRNVLIYFSAEMKRNIIERIARLLNPGGYLLLGSTESMSDHADLFKMCHLQGGLAYRRH